VTYRSLRSSIWQRWCRRQAKFHFKQICVRRVIGARVIARAIHSPKSGGEPDNSGLRAGAALYPSTQWSPLMKFRPLHDRIVVERLDAEAKSAGGIIIPDTAQEKPSQGKVVAVGPGGRDEAGKLIPIDLKAGDRVLFGKWSGTEVKIDSIDYLIMKESDIMGVIDEPAAKKKAA
jgi:chaperonin GroES